MHRLSGIMTRKGERGGTGRPDTHRGHGLEAATALPGEPTEAMPGTLEKILVMEERASRGERLWHPKDAGCRQEDLL